jgi:hypothetical protein
MFDVRLLLVWRPGDGKDVEPSGMAKESMSLQENESQLG